MRREELTIRAQMQALKNSLQRNRQFVVQSGVHIQIHEKSVEVCSLGSGAWRAEWFSCWVEHAAGERFGKRHRWAGIE
jgi:hypothetical protein